MTCPASDISSRAPPQISGCRSSQSESPQAASPIACCSPVSHGPGSSPFAVYYLVPLEGATKRVKFTEGRRRGSGVCADRSRLPSGQRHTRATRGPLPPPQPILRARPQARSRPSSGALSGSGDSRRPAEVAAASSAASGIEKDAGGGGSGSGAVNARRPPTCQAEDRRPSHGLRKVSSIKSSLCSCDRTVPPI